MATIKDGTYSTPLGELVVKTGPLPTELYVTFISRENSNKQITWCFRDEKFSHFEIGSEEANRNPDQQMAAIMGCEHITPAYVGTVYRTHALDGKMEVYCCPKCVEVEVVSNRVPINVIDREIWKVISSALHIVDAKARSRDD